MGASTSAPAPPPSPSAPAARQLRVGDRFPAGTAFAPFPDSVDVELLDIETRLRGAPVELGALFAGKRVVLLGAPGAFTPNCSQFHLPSFIQAHAQFVDCGVDKIVCLIVNDIFVCAAWRAALGTGDKVDVLCDPTGAIARSAGLLLETTRPTLGRPVVKRFCALLEDGVVRLLQVEKDGLGLSCTLAPPLLNEVRSKKYRELLDIKPMARDQGEPAELPAAAAASSVASGGSEPGAAPVRSPTTSLAKVLPG